MEWNRKVDFLIIYKFIINKLIKELNKWWENLGDKGR